ncbi:ABC transporter substrate-binding protein [Isoptericola sp. BMS4]|uniref:ABC transporter substrate-binding protein n=1 Tax=Isoptericola sp. BMS4 TaxID=2527875 RepID=UPI001420C855|nr:extracellular solute-binding protein [Isoptericola sp. BMS4]
MRELSRRNFLVAVGAAAGTGILASCSGVAGGSGGSGERTLRYAFWGNTVRQQNYEQAFGQMKSALDITLNVEFADYDAYQERMTTQMAAGNVADIFWVPSPHVMTYEANDLYLPLSEISSLDLSDYSEADLRDFELAGTLNTMPFGIFVPVVRSNRTMAEQDGVEIPDDWDWDWLADFAADYSKNAGGERKALSYGADHDLSFEAWLRQHGEQLWTEDGQIGFSADGLGAWIEWWEKLRTSGATTSISEQDGVSPSWEDVGDRCLLWFGNSNHIVDDSAMYPETDFRLHQPPAAADATEGHPFLYFPRMAVYQQAAEERAELAGEVVGYCTSDVEMQKVVGLTMGVPPNPRVAEEYAQFATPDEQEMLRITTQAREADRLPRYEAPPGTSAWRTTFTRVLEEVTVGQAGVAAAAESMIAEIERGISRAAD